MKKTTKRSIILGCVFVLLSAINLIMEYKKSTPSDLAFKWIMLVFFIIFALVSFIRYKKTAAEKVDDNEKKST
jgi:peptidoglycan/LPS O-acetylase OafA/YrhL